MRFSWSFSRLCIASVFCTSFLAFSARSFAQAPPPFNGGGGGVAFDPEISIVTSGALLDAQVVVSEDRRYVTINMRPTLSRLQSLDTFQAEGFSTGGGSTAGGGGASAGGGKGAMAARMGYVGSAGYIDDSENSIAEDVPKPAQSKESAERAAHGGNPPPNTSAAPTSSSPTEILKIDPTAANSVLRKEGMFRITSAK